MLSKIDRSKGWWIKYKIAFSKYKGYYILVTRRASWLISTQLAKRSRKSIWNLRAVDKCVVLYLRILLSVNWSAIFVHWFPICDMYRNELNMLILAFSKIKISKCYGILLRVSRSGDIRTQVHTTLRLHEMSLRV